LVRRAGIHGIAVTLRINILMLIEIVICSNEAGAARLDTGDVGKQEDE
jgi:hypothetical protein